MEIYVVQPGDTPESIVARYVVSPQRPTYDNQLAELPYLPAGMAVLVLIPTLLHTVAEGENVEEIAAAYGLIERQLYQNNPYVLNQSYLRTGQSLVIRYQGQEEHNLYVTGYAYPFVEDWVLREALLYLDDLSGLADGGPADSRADSLFRAGEL